MSNRAVQVELLLSGLRDDNGTVLSGGKVYTYSAGTTTNKTTWTDNEKTTAAANPIILDSAGKSQIWADGLYKFVIKDSNDVTVYTYDDLKFDTGYVKGADVASAAALPLIDDGDANDVTGTTTITSMDSVSVGTIKWLHFDSALTLTHDATNLILNGNNITTATGDVACFQEYDTGKWRLLIGKFASIADDLTYTGTVYFDDDAFILRDNADSTKQLQFQCSGITPGNTRTIAFPDANTTFGFGTFSPTLTGVTNVAAVVTVDKALHSRQGTIVTGTVDGRITPTAGSTLTKVRCTLPVSSNFAIDSDVIGSGVVEATGGGAFNAVKVIADTSNDELEIWFYTLGTTNSHTFYINFQYEII